MAEDMNILSNTEPVPSAGSRAIRTSPEDFKKGKRSKPKTMTVQEASKRLSFGVRAPDTMPMDNAAIAPVVAGRTPAYDPFSGQDVDPETGAEAVLKVDINEYPTNVDDMVDPPTGYVGQVQQPDRIQWVKPADVAPLVVRNQQPLKKLVMGLVDGDMHIRVQDIISSTYGVVVLLPQDSTALFMPKPGTEIKLSWDDKVEACFFPGVTFELDMIKCTALVFIKQESS